MTAHMAPTSLRRRQHWHSDLTGLTMTDMGGVWSKVGCG